VSSSLTLCTSAQVAQYGRRHGAKNAGSVSSSLTLRTKFAGMVKLAKAPHSDCGDCVGSNPTPGTTGVSVNWQTSRLQIGDCGFESCYPCQVHAESWPSGLRRRTANAERMTPSQVRILYSPPSSEGAAEWPASGPENRGSMMMSRGFDSSTFRQVCTRGQIWFAALVCKTSRP
jgi:hypothetical protein